MFVVDCGSILTGVILLIINHALCQPKRIEDILLKNTLIIHYDNLSISIFDRLFIPELGQPVIMFNYDYNETGMSRSRYCCGQFSDGVANLVLLDNKTMFERGFSTIKGNIKPQDIILQVTNDTNIQPYVTNPRFTQQYVYEISEGKLYNITPIHIDTLRFGFVGCDPVINVAEENGFEYLVGSEHMLAKLVAEVMHSKLVFMDYSNSTRPEVITLVKTCNFSAKTQIL